MNFSVIVNCCEFFKTTFKQFSFSFWFRITAKCQILSGERGSPSNSFSTVQNIWRWSSDPRKDERLRNPWGSECVQLLQYLFVCACPLIKIKSGFWIDLFIKMKALCIFFMCVCLIWPKCVELVCVQALREHVKNPFGSKAIARNGIWGRTRVLPPYADHVQWRLHLRPLCRTTQWTPWTSEPAGQLCQYFCRLTSIYTALYHQHV